VNKVKHTHITAGMLVALVVQIATGYTRITDKDLCPVEIVKVQVTQPEQDNRRLWQLEILHVYSADKDLLGKSFPLHAIPQGEMSYNGTIHGLKKDAVAIWPVSRSRPYSPIWDGENKNPRPEVQSSHHVIIIQLPYVMLPSFEGDLVASPQQNDAILWAETLERISAIPVQRRYEAVRTLLNHEKSVIAGWAAQVLLNVGTEDEQDRLARQWVSDATLALEVRFEADKQLLSSRQDAWRGSTERITILSQLIKEDMQDVTAMYMIQQVGHLGEGRAQQSFMLLTQLYEQENASMYCKTSVLGMLQRLVMKNTELAPELARFLVHAAFDSASEELIRVRAAMAVHALRDVSAEMIEQYILECETTMMTTEDDEHRERILELLRTKPKPRENLPSRNIKDMKHIATLSYTGNQNEQEHDEGQRTGGKKD
jgi:hypothetical protein